MCSSDLKDAALPRSKSGSFLRLETAPDGRGATATIENAQLILRMHPVLESRIDAIALVKEGDARDLAGLLAAHRKLENIPGAQVVSRFLDLITEEGAAESRRTPP